MISKLLSRVIIRVCGCLYPAYASYKTVRTKNVENYVMWMMYWIAFAIFTCIEMVADIFIFWFPFYYEIKVIFVFWLLSPITDGSSILYRQIVHPLLRRNESKIDEWISLLKDQSYHTLVQLSKKAFHHISVFIMDTLRFHNNLHTPPEERQFVNNLMNDPGSIITSADDDNEEIKLQESKEATNLRRNKSRGRTAKKKLPLMRINKHL